MSEFNECKCCGFAINPDFFLCSECMPIHKNCIPRSEIEGFREYLKKEISGFTVLRKEERDTGISEFYRGVIVGYLNVRNDLNKILEKK